MEIIWVLGSYFLGCFTPGYYWVRWRTGRDLRRLGSGSLGARNAGRAAGLPGFFVTLAVDVGKGMLAVGVARWAGMDPYVMMAALFAVVLGHNWPCQLRFQGGKGVAVSLGALLIYDPFIVLILPILLLPGLLVLRNFTLSGLLAYGLAPLMVFLAGWGPRETFTMSIVAGLVLVAHRANLRDEMCRWWENRRGKSITSPPPQRGAS